MLDWVAAHGYGLTLVLTIVLGFLIFGIWASSHEAPKGAPGTPAASRDPAGRHAMKDERDFRRDTLRYGEGDIPLDDAIDRNRPRPGDGFFK